MECGGVTDQVSYGARVVKVVFTDTGAESPLGIMLGTPPFALASLPMKGGGWRRRPQSTALACHATASCSLSLKLAQRQVFSEAPLHTATTNPIPSREPPSPRPAGHSNHDTTSSPKAELHPHSLGARVQQPMWGGGQASLRGVRAPGPLGCVRGNKEATTPAAQRVQGKMTWRVWQSPGGVLMQRAPEPEPAGVEIRQHVRPGG